MTLRLKFSERLSPAHSILPTLLRTPSITSTSSSLRILPTHHQALKIERLHFIFAFFPLTLSVSRSSDFLICLLFTFISQGHLRPVSNGSYNYYIPLSFFCSVLPPGPPQIFVLLSITLYNRTTLQTLRISNHQPQSSLGNLLRDTSSCSYVVHDTHDTSSLESVTQIPSFQIKII